MCFSAGASFTGGVVLSAIGVVTVRRIQEPSQKLFAGIPLFFAFQQFAEGIIWVTLQSGAYENLQRFATFVFLITALVLWPTIIPLAVFQMEKVKKKKTIITWFLFPGILLSVYYTFCLLSFNVSPRIDEFHIRYVSDFPKTLGYVGFGIYALVTITPLFISSIRRMPLFGILVFLSCLVTGIFYKEYLTSVWCFFASVISCIVYLIIRESQEEFNPSGFKLSGLISNHANWRNRFRF